MQAKAVRRSLGEGGLSLSITRATAGKPATLARVLLLTSVGWPDQQPVTPSARWHTMPRVSLSRTRIALWAVVVAIVLLFEVRLSDSWTHIAPGHGAPSLWNPGEPVALNLGSHVAVDPPNSAPSR